MSKRCPLKRKFLNEFDDEILARIEDAENNYDNLPHVKLKVENESRALVNGQPLVYPPSEESDRIYKGVLRRIGLAPEQLTRDTVMAVIGAYDPDGRARAAWKGRG